MNAPPVKITPQKFDPLRKLPPIKIFSPLRNHTNERKKKNYKIFCFEESCATQKPYQNNQGPL